MTPPSPQTPDATGTAIHWFRNDLRLHDNAALLRSVTTSRELLCIYVHDPRHDAEVRWGFRRMGRHRRAALADSLQDLARNLGRRGQRLYVARGRPAEVVAALAVALQIHRITCEQIAAPEEQSDLAAVIAAGLPVEAIWQSSLIDPGALPFELPALPRVFTVFRKRVESAGVVPARALPVPRLLPPPPKFSPASLPASISLVEVVSPTTLSALLGVDREEGDSRATELALADDPRSALPYRSAEFRGGESAALQHLDQYFDSDLPQRYKSTRNGLIGTRYSTRLSAWLASGALSPRLVYEALRAHEARCGSSEETYWIWFELLWRDYFRFLHLCHGRQLYLPSGLSARPTPTHDSSAFTRWCEGQTDQPFIDAGMRELVTTGYLSNRMRQNVASFLVNDLQCDFRAGAAWFEAMLVDYDACSNQGNWLYLAGRGTDPRDGRRFDPQRQAHLYDRDGAYRGLWSASR